MGIPVVIKPSGGMPVTVSPYGTPMTEASNGFGIAVTEAPNGLPVAGITFGPTLALSAASVPESAAVNTTVGTLSLTPGTTGTPVYSLTDSAGGKFNISGALLRTNAALDFETASYHNVTVAVSGVTPAVANRQFTILVTDGLEPVIMLSLATVAETAAIGTTVGVLSLINSYTGTPAYTLVDNAGGRFAISGSNLNVAATLDYETATSHSVTVSVSGVSPPALNKVFTIAVTDMPEPVIALTGTTASEDAAIGTTVGTLSLLNSYTGTPVYTLTDSAGGKFAISGSNLNVAAALDYETASMHSVTVAVSGITPAAANKAFTVVVLDAEDALGGDVTVTWDPLFYDSAASHVTYSGGNLIASTGGSSTNWNNACALLGASTGKYYCEFRFTSSIAAIPGWALVGLRTYIRANLGSSNLGSDLHTIGYAGSGDVLKDNGTDVKLASVTFAQNHWIAMAVDLDARKIWFKNITTGGSWNGVGGDPDAGTNGITTPAGGWTYYPACTLSYGTSNTYVCEANFGVAAYAGVKPSTFNNWSTVTNSLTWNYAHPLSGSAAYTNNKLTATGNLVTTTWNTAVCSGARQVSYDNRYYCEFHIDTAISINEILIGLCSTTFTSNIVLGMGGNSIGWNVGLGTFKIGTVDRFVTPITAAAGHYLAMAVDTISNKIWVKNITSGNNWNGVSGDPAAGTGGIDVAAMAGGDENVGPCAQIGYDEAGNAITANFGATAYQQTPPVGFGNWGHDAPSVGGGGGVTKNIVTDYGAVANALWFEGTFSIAMGSYSLTCATSIWNSGDVGKHIVVSSMPFGSPLSTTIASFVSGTNVILADTPPANWNNSANAATGGSMVNRSNVIVSWALVNNASAFQAFKDEFQEETVTLTIPAGTYLVKAGNFGGLFDGIRNITCNAVGATLCGGMFQIQAAAQHEGMGHSSYTASVSAGATSVTLLTPSDVSKFVIGDYAMMTGFDMQNLGYPTNQARHEYLLITAIDSDVGSPTYGKITFLTPLLYAYLSTWPLYTPENSLMNEHGVLIGNQSYGGPATLYAMNPRFNHTSVVNGMTIAQGEQYGVSGLDLTFNDCAFVGLGQLGPHMTMAKYIAFNNCDASRMNIEVDKLCHRVTSTGTTWGGLYVQSSSINELILDNSDIAYSVWTPRKLTIKNGCSIAALLPNPATYGFADVLNVSNSVVGAFGTETYHGNGFEIRNGDGSGADGIEKDFTMTAGVISVPASMRWNKGLSQWAITGGRMHFVDANLGSLGLFTITDVTDIGTHILVHTNWAQNGGTFPPSSYAGGGLWLKSHNVTSCTFNAVSGCAEVQMLSNCVPHPLGSQYKRVFNGDVVDSGYWQLQGRIKYIKVEILGAYSGPTATVTLTLLFGNATVKMSDFSQVIWNPVINLKTGPRSVIFDTDADPYPTAWTGGVAGDTLTGMAEAQWACGNFRLLMTDITAEPTPPTTRPTYIVTVVTDQGVA